MSQNMQSGASTLDNINIVCKICGPGCTGARPKVYKNIEKAMEPPENMKTKITDGKNENFIQTVNPEDDLELSFEFDKIPLKN